VKLNATDRITILYNFTLVLFTFIFRAKIAAYAYHLAFNLSVILLVLFLSFRRRSSLTVGTVGLWYPLGLYALFYYQTGLINRVVVPQFMDGFFFESGRPHLRQISRFFPPWKPWECFPRGIFSFLLLKLLSDHSPDRHFAIPQGCKALRELRVPALLLVLRVLFHLHIPACSGTGRIPK
jgi:hypothetical protein